MDRIKNLAMFLQLLDFQLLFFKIEKINIIISKKIF
jgi:hypothetical protein